MGEVPFLKTNNIYTAQDEEMWEAREREEAVKIECWES